MKMSKFKKTILASSMVLLAIVGTSKLAYAVNYGTTYYGVELPSTGYQTIAPTTKSNTSKNFVNNVTYSDSNDRIDFWGYLAGNSPTNNVTTQSFFYGTGVKYAYYASLSDGVYFKGKNIGMTIKTGPSVYHKIFIQGQYTP